MPDDTEIMPDDKANYRPNELLCTLCSDASEEQAREAVERAGGTVLKVMSNGRLTIFLIGAEDVHAAMNKLNEQKCFTNVQLNHLARPQ